MKDLILVEKELQIQHMPNSVNNFSFMPVNCVIPATLTEKRAMKKEELYYFDIAVYLNPSKIQFSLCFLAILSIPFCDLTKKGNAKL